MTSPSRPLRITLLSNGHGEDVVGARLLRAFAERTTDVTLQAYPTVDRGDAYEGLGVPILGPRRVMPSGGLLFHHPALFWRDLRAGFLGMTGRQLRDLRRLDTDILVVVGDIYALLLASLVPARERYYLQLLVSAYHSRRQPSEPHRTPLNRLTMERVTGLERFLIRLSTEHVYVRDAATEQLLRRQGLAKVSYLGNPMLDALFDTDSCENKASTEDLSERLSLSSPVVALLPGTRRYAHTSLQLMMPALAAWPAATGLIAWVLGDVPEVPGWTYRPCTATTEPGLVGVFARGEQRVYLLKHRFAAVLRAADLVLGTAGTAHEQAAALGRPVVAFPLEPSYSPAFLRNQKRLLGAALTVSEARPEAIATALRNLHEDSGRWAEAARAGPVRMGSPGGTNALVDDVLRRSKLYRTVC